MLADSGTRLLTCLHRFFWAKVQTFIQDFSDKRTGLGHMYKMVYAHQLIFHYSGLFNGFFSAKVYLLQQQSLQIQNTALQVEDAKQQLRIAAEYQVCFYFINQVAYDFLKKVLFLKICLPAGAVIVWLVYIAIKPIVLKAPPKLNEIILMSLLFLL